MDSYFNYYFLHTHLASLRSTWFRRTCCIFGNLAPILPVLKVKNWEQNYQPFATWVFSIPIMCPYCFSQCWAFMPPSFACKSILMPCWQTPHVKFVFRAKNNSMTCWWSRDSRWIHGNVLVASSCVSSGILLHHSLLPCFIMFPCLTPGVWVFFPAGADADLLGRAVASSAMEAAGNMWGRGHCWWVYIHEHTCK